MKIHYFAQVYNEARLVPYVFRHYDNIVDHYYIWNHASTDNTKALLLQNPKVTVFDIPASKFDDEDMRVFKNTAWKPFSNCDWVIISDFDEFLYHNDLLSLLERYKKEGVTVVKTQGYQMYSSSFPETDKQIYDVIKTGLKEPLYSKCNIINPSIDPNYSYGAHHIYPSGNVKYSEPEIKLLHYRVFGEEFIDLMMTRNERLSEFNKSLGLAVYRLENGFPFNPRVIHDHLKNNSTFVI